MLHDPKSKKVAEATASKAVKDSENTKTSELNDEIVTNYKHIVKRQDQS